MSYLSRKQVDKSYRPRSYVMSPGLLRARAPFRLQNAITGVVLAGFATVVWAYSIRAVKQDDFSDVDDEARELMKTRQTKEVEDVLGRVTVPVESTTTAGVVDPRPRPQPRGLLVLYLDRAFPSLLDPTTKTLVWGAPPVDDIGRMWTKDR